MAKYKIVKFSEIARCGRLDAKHHISGEHERLCMDKKRSLMDDLVVDMTTTNPSVPHKVLKKAVETAV